MSKAESNKFFFMEMEGKIFSVKRDHKTNVQNEIEQGKKEMNILIDKQNSIREELLKLNNKISDKKMSLLTKRQLLELYRGKRRIPCLNLFKKNVTDVYIDDDTDSDEDC